MQLEQAFAQNDDLGFTTEAESNGKFLVDATDLMSDAMKVSNTIRRITANYVWIKHAAPCIPCTYQKLFPLNSENLE